MDEIYQLIESEIDFLYNAELSRKLACFINEEAYSEMTKLIRYEIHLIDFQLEGGTINQ